MYGIGDRFSRTKFGLLSSMDEEEEANQVRIRRERRLRKYEKGGSERERN